jgi:hypothetical protein
MKNNLADLNNHLFAMLEELEDDDLEKDPQQLEKTLKKARAISSVSSQILKVANTQIQAIKTMENCGLVNKDMPALLAIKDSSVESAQRQKLLGGTK